MKVHWLIPLTCDAAFQFTSKNELAKAFRDLGNEITTTVAYINEQTPMDGFSDVEYVHTPRRSLFAKIKFHWKMVLSIWKSDADVIMFGFQAAHLMPLAALWRGKRVKQKYIMDIRTIPVDVSPGFAGQIELGRYNLSLWLADRYCDGLTAITPMLASTLHSKLKRLKQKIGIWTSGVNLRHFTRDGEDRRKELGLDGKQVLLYHGILSPNRGIQNVIHALHILRDEFPELTFLIVGDGPGRNEFEELVRTLKMVRKVLFVGRVPYKDIPNYVRSANLAILPFPDIEWWAVSSPIKLMEYLAAGIPMVATDIEAHRWVVEKTGGAVLAKNEQPESLAKTLRYALKNRVESVNLDKLQQTISWKKQAGELQVFLQNLCKKESIY